MNAMTDLSVLILTRNVLIYLEHLDVSAKMATRNCEMETVKVYVVPVFNTSTLNICELHELRYRH